ncbi:GyrI-like domain-containing protein [Pseudoalteromonas ostreae]|uniref:GyrI-like domain-containing protein n=1 Tax=Pseudoalteromonas ostreae TaxID=2774154 RepID=UPI001E35899A|nr:GyrI-like domain-containing protein [Pseudoalteromonas ostreae]
MDVEIINFSEQKVTALAHYDAPKLHHQTSMKFMAWRKTSKLSPIKTSNTYGIPYSDPNIVKAEDFHFDLSGAIKADIPENDYVNFIHDVPEHKLITDIYLPIK